MNCNEALVKLFAALVVNRYNIHMLHWRVSGKAFDPVHATHDEYVGQFGEFIDEIGEIMQMHGVRIPSLPECLTILEQDTENKYLILGQSDKDFYAPEETFSAIETIFGGLMNLYDIVENCGLSGDVVGTIQNQHYWVRKELCYKNKYRTTNTDCCK